MDTAIAENFWNQVIADIGDRYRPHSAAYGVFLFQEKLRVRDFCLEQVVRRDPKLIARAAPWAMFQKFADREYLRLSGFGTPRYKKFCKPHEAFSCFDQNFHLHLGRVVPEFEWTVDEIVLLARVSVGRLKMIEASGISLHDAFRHAENGEVLRIEIGNGRMMAVRCGDLNESELPE